MIDLCKKIWNSLGLLRIQIISISIIVIAFISLWSYIFILQQVEFTIVDVFRQTLTSLILGSIVSAIIMYFNIIKRKKNNENIIDNFNTQTFIRIFILYNLFIVLIIIILTQIENGFLIKQFDFL